MNDQETSYARQAVEADPMFVFHLIAALSVSHGDWLESMALTFLEMFHDDDDDDDAPWHNTAKV